MFSAYSLTELLKGLFFSVFCIAILFPEKCFCNGESTENGEVMIVNKQDNGKEVQANVGDVIQIELESLGGAGYKWFPDNLDSNYLEQISEETEVTGEKEKTGSPVISVWRFKLRKKGVTDITMSHYRLWEGREKASDNFHIKINIH